MTGKNYFIICLLITVSSFVKGQEAVLCSLQTDIFKVEDSVNIPIVTSNGDDTISLTFPDQNVTDVFSNYSIYDFSQAYPNSSETLEKYYKITFNSKALIEDIHTSVPIDIIAYAGSSTGTSSFPIKTEISQAIIDYLDGNTYELTKYVFTSDSDPCGNPCTLTDFPETLSFIVSFNYDITKEILFLQSFEPTTCGNSFLIGLTGGNPNYFGNIDNTLQLWESTPGLAAETEYSQPCHYLESEIFSVLDIACNGYNYGNIQVQIDSETESFQFYRENAIFGHHILEFSKVNLSIEEENFQQVKPFQLEGNPFLHIANLNNQTISVNIYNTSGQLIVQSELFEENSINISNFSTGLYFIRISNLNNQQKIFKFLKN